jgi:hypothetical protein
VSAVATTAAATPTAIAAATQTRPQQREEGRSRSRVQPVGARIAEDVAEQRTAELSRGSIRRRCRRP